MIDMMSYLPSDVIYNGFQSNAKPSSPTMYTQGIASPDFNSLMENFVQSPYTPEQDSTMQYQSAGMYSTMHPGPMQPTGFGGFEANHMYLEGQSSSSSGDSSFFSNSNVDTMLFADGLRIHRDHLQQPIPPQPSSYITEQPSPATVSFLEQAVLQAPAFKPHQSYTGGIGRQSRSSTLSDGVAHMSTLSLDSPRHSASTAGSSVSSSQQNSPVTPLSAHSLDASASFAAQQHQHLQQQRYMAQLAQSGGGHLPSQAMQQNFNPLSASLPPSYIAQNQVMHQEAFPQQQHFVQSTNPLSRSMASVPITHSSSRMSSAGLMDQIVLRQSATSGVERDPTSMGSLDHALSRRASKKSSKRHSRSNSGVSSSSPPLTPARAALRASRSATLAGHNQQDSSTPVAVGQQTPSRAGPHRTPVKTPGTGTPKRPDLRRTASHNPNISRKSTPTSGNLQSPAGLDALRSPYTTSSTNSAQLARVMGGGIELDFASDLASNGMTRAASNPGWATTSGTRSRSSSSLTSSTSGGDQSRRSSTVLSLQMSPLPAGVGFGGQPLSAPPSASATSHLPVSHKEALRAIASIKVYLSQQASILERSPPQSAATVLGTYEQCYAAEDLFRRIQAKASISS